MASLEGIMRGARTYMRDNPKFFMASAPREGLSQTLRFPHLNIMPQGLFVAATDGTTVANGVLDNPSITANGTLFGYILDEREGLMRVSKPRTGGMAGWMFTMEGYYCEWMSESDLRYFSNNIVAEHGFRRAGFDLELIDDVEEDALALGAACEALWSLLIEYSRDVDVSTIEGISIPAGTRYQKVADLLFGSGQLKAKYANKASMIGVGIDRVEVMTLRRVSRQTNRLVPLYRPREWDDGSLPQRVFPIIDQEGQSNPQPGFRRMPTVGGWLDGMIPLPSNQIVIDVNSSPVVAPIGEISQAAQDMPPLVWTASDPISLSFSVAGVDWSGSYTAQVRDHGNALMGTFTVTAVYNGTNTLITLTMSQVNSALIPVGTYSWDLQQVGGVTRLRGDVYVQPQVTQ